MQFGFINKIPHLQQKTIATGHSGQPGTSRGNEAALFRADLSHN